MRKNILNIIIFLIIIFLGLLSLFLFYFLIKKPSPKPSPKTKCIPDCKNKKCGDSDNCKGSCTYCPKGICTNGKCKMPEPKKSGVMLFDIDGTWDIVKNKKELFDLVLSNKYSIGIDTAGGYDLDTCNTRSQIFGKNMCDYLKQNNYLTFNAVRGDVSILNGEKTPGIYDIACKNIKNINHDGCRKGYAMEKTMKKLGVNCGVLVDNDSRVVEGFLQYGKLKGLNFIAIHAGYHESSDPKTPLPLIYETLDNYFRGKQCN